MNSTTLVENLKSWHLFRRPLCQKKDIQSLIEYFFNHIYLSKCVCVDAYVRACMRACVCVCVCMCLCVHMYVCMRAHLRVCECNQLLSRLPPCLNEMRFKSIAVMLATPPKVVKLVYQANFTVTVTNTLLPFTSRWQSDVDTRRVV